MTGYNYDTGTYDPYDPSSEDMPFYTLPDFVVTAGWTDLELLNFEAQEAVAQSEYSQDQYNNEDTTSFSLDKIYNYNKNGVYSDKIFRKYNPETKQRELAGVFVNGYFYPPDSLLPLGGTDQFGNKIEQFPLREDRPKFVGSDVAQGIEVFEKYLMQFDYSAAKGADSINNFLRYAIQEKGETFGVSSMEAANALAHLIDNQQIDLGQVSYEKSNGEYGFQKDIRDSSDEPFEYEIDTNFEYSPFKNQSQLPIDPNDKRFSTPSSNVPSNFTQPAGYRTYKDPSTGSTFYDNPLLDSRLNEVEKDRLHENLDYTTSLDYELTITKPINPYLANDVNEVLVVKDTIWDNISKATAALAFNNPGGKIDKPTVLKAVSDTVGSSLNTAMGVANIASAVQDIVEGVVNFLSDTKNFDLGPDIPSSAELVDVTLAQFGIDSGINYDKQARDLQKDYSRNFNKAYKEGLISREQYGELNGRYMDFLAGYGKGNTEQQIQSILDPSLSDILGSYANEVVLPQERSQILLDNIVADYHMGKVTKGDVLSAVEAHQMMLNGGGPGVTSDVYKAATGQAAPFILEARIPSVSIDDFSDDWKLDFSANLLNKNIKYNFDFDRLLPIDSNDEKYDEFKQWKNEFQNDLDLLFQAWGTPTTDNELANLPENYLIKAEAVQKGAEAFFNSFKEAGFFESFNDLGSYFVNYETYKQAQEDPAVREQILERINAETQVGLPIADQINKFWSTQMTASQMRAYENAEAAAIAAFESHYETMFDSDEQILWKYTLRDNIDEYNMLNPIKPGEVRTDNVVYQILADASLGSFEMDETVSRALGSPWKEDSIFSRNQADYSGTVTFDYSATGSSMTLFDYEVIENLANDSVGTFIDIVLANYTPSDNIELGEFSVDPDTGVMDLGTVVKINLDNQTAWETPWGDDDSVLGKEGAKAIDPDDFAKGVNEFFKKNPDADNAQTRTAYYNALDVLNINKGLKDNNMTGQFTIADTVDIGSPEILNSGIQNLDLNNYLSLDVDTGEVVDKVQENVTALTVGARGLYNSVEVPQITLSGTPAYTPVGELDLDTKFDINKFKVPQYEIANYFDGQGLPSLPKKEGYKESERMKDYTDEYLNGVKQTITVDSNNAEEFYNFQKEQYDVAMEYFKNEVSSIDFNYATSPEQVGQAILNVLVDMEQKNMFQFTTHAQGPALLYLHILEIK